MSQPIADVSTVPGWVKELSRPANAVPIAFLIFIATLILFFPAVHNNFVNYDDNVYVTGNPHVQQGLTPAGLHWALTSSDASNWHPLTWVSHMVDCSVFGMQPWGHHLTSVLLHALNTALVFLLLRRMTGTGGRSLLVALLFGFHPLRVESVAWIAERKDVLGAFFWLATLLAYTRYSQEAKVKSLAAKKYYGWAIGGFILGLMSKPMLVTLPFVLLLLDFWPLARINRSTFTKLMLEKIPFFLLSAGSCVVTFAAQKKGGSVAETLPLAGRIENAVVAYCRYLGKTVWPIKLSVYYPYVEQWPMKTIVLCGVTLILMTGAAILIFRKFPFAAAGWFWFIGTLIPVIGLVQVGMQSMADRYTYIPSIGLLIAFVWGTYYLTNHLHSQIMVASFTVAAVLLACCVLTRQQISYWKGNETLFRHSLDVTENNWLAHNDLGAALLHPGTYDQAIEQLQAAIKLYPLSHDAHDNLGIALKNTGHLDAAIQEYRLAIKLAPHNAATHYNLAIALKKQGNLNEAISEYQAALALKPTFTQAREGLTAAMKEKPEVPP